MVERLNQTLKAMLRKRAAEFGPQWDVHLLGLVWAYKNTPHEFTCEKPSFFLFGCDCHSPSETALLPTSPSKFTSMGDCHEEPVLTLSTTWKAALTSVQKAQGRKAQCDRHAASYPYQIGDWIRFPCEETGKTWKPSRPWHRPYWVISLTDTNVTAKKVYFPDEAQARCTKTE